MLRLQIAKSDNTAEMEKLCKQAITQSLKGLTVQGMRQSVVNFGLKTGTQMLEAGKNFGKGLIKRDVEQKEQSVFKWAALYEKLFAFTNELGYTKEATPFDLESLVLTEVLKSSEP